MRNRDAIAKAARAATKRGRPLSAQGARALVRKYSPDQPRDDQGQFAETGAGEAPKSGWGRTALRAAAITAALGVGVPIATVVGARYALGHLARRLSRQMRETRRTYRPKPARERRPKDFKI